MPLVIALLVIVVLFVLLWKLRDTPPRPGSGSAGRKQPSRGRSVPPGRPHRSVGPDDDPDFMRELGRRTRPPREDPDK